MKKQYLYLGLLLTVFLLTIAATRPSCTIVSWLVGSQTVVTCPPFNARGDGTTDDTKALQAAIDAAPDFSTVLLPRGNYRVTDTIVVSNRAGLKITSMSGNGQSGGTQITYDGPNDQPVLRILNSRDNVFEYFTLLANDKANAGIKAEMFSGKGQATTFNRFHGMGFNGGNSPRSGFIGLDICGNPEAEQNCEKFVVTESWFSTATGTNTRGIVVGHSNALSHTIADNVFHGFTQGVRIVNGSATVRANLFDAVEIIVAAVDPDPIVIEFNRQEGAKQFFVALGATQAVLMGNRFGTVGTSPGVWIDCTACGSGARITFINNVFSGDPFLQVTPFAGGAGQLLSMNNGYDPRQVVNGQIASMETFNGGYTSLNDSGIKSIFSAGTDRSVGGHNPAYLLHAEDYFGIIVDGSATQYKLFGSDASANQIFGDTAKPMTLQGSGVTVTNRTTGTPAKFACFTSAGLIVESATACQ